ncbi:hypothetical protein BDR07DRAFT_783221 [Suillus spraguei]|nr:hypothetical protein BDR07DRAFT_783221 [Suillus spraguei]
MFISFLTYVPAIKSSAHRHEHLTLTVTNNNYFISFFLISELTSFYIDYNFAPHAASFQFMFISSTVAFCLLRHLSSFFTFNPLFLVYMHLTFHISYTLSHFASFAQI